MPDRDPRFLGQFFSRSEPDPGYDSDFESRLACSDHAFEPHDLISYLVCKVCRMINSKPARDSDL